jgi:hypothetical protein
MLLNCLNKEKKWEKDLSYLNIGVAVNDMQNFVFKTRNPEYVWYLIAVLITIALIPSIFYGWEYLGFIVTYGIYIPMIIGGGLAHFISTTKIEVSKSEIAITKRILGIVSYSYKQSFEYYRIENHWTICFAGYHVTPLRFAFVSDFEVDDYFVVYIQGKEIILGDERGFTKFKESLEE